MYYCNTTMATGWKKEELESLSVRMWKAFLFFIPRANKDNEKYYHLVKSWWLEIDDKGVPMREIGIDENGEPLFSAPNDRNYGLWTDNNEIFNPDEMDVIDKDKFNEAWDKLSRA
jgi:hypothetical protein